MTESHQLKRSEVILPKTCRIFDCEQPPAYARIGSTGKVNLAYCRDCFPRMKDQFGLSKFPWTEIDLHQNPATLNDRPLHHKPVGSKHHKMVAVSPETHETLKRLVHEARNSQGGQIGANDFIAAALKSYLKEKTSARDHESLNPTS